MLDLRLAAHLVAYLLYLGKVLPDHKINVHQKHQEDEQTQTEAKVKLSQITIPQELTEQHHVVDGAKHKHLVHQFDTVVGTSLVGLLEAVVDDVQQLEEDDHLDLQRGPVEPNNREAKDYKPSEEEDSIEVDI